MPRPVLQFTRLTNAGRLPDRFVACQIREFFESGADRQARLFLLVEIVRPWLAASQIGQALIQAFVGGYQDAGTTDELKQVEAGLKRVNETLLHLTQQGETEWVGHLHALFALEVGGQIHVAQTGRAGAVLVRDRSVNRITELEGAQAAATASHTFGTITSGELTPGDAVVIGSGELFRALGNDVIADSLHENTAADAVRRFAKILRQHQTRAAAGIVIRAYDARTLADQPLMADPEVIYLDEQPMETLGGSLRSLGRRLGRYALAGTRQLSRAGQSVSKAVQTQVAPKSKALFESGQKTAGTAFNDVRKKHWPKFMATVKPLVAKAGDAAQKAASRSMTEIQKLADRPSTDPTPEQVANEAPEPRRQTPDASPGLIGKDLYTVRHYTEASTRSIVAVLKRLHLPKLGLPKLSWLTDVAKPKHRPRLYGLVAALLLIILIINVSLLHARQQKTQQSAAAAAAIIDLRTKLDDAKLKLAIKNDPSVASDLESILVQVTPLVANSAVASSATALQHDVQDTFDGLTKSTRIRDPKLIATFDHPKSLARLGSNLVTTQSSSSKLLASPIAGQLIDDGSALPTGETGVTLTRLDQPGTIVALSNKPSVYQLSKPGDTPAPLSLAGGSWESALSMASFGNNLYLLDPTSNQIWKHAIADGGNYSAGGKYITDGTNVSNGISLAIDGSIYVLAADGSITKLTHGQKDNFTIKDLPKNVSLSDARAIWTDADTSSIYVLTKTAVIVLSKNGSYSRRYISDQFTDLSAFVVDPPAKQTWVLSGDKVYELNLTGA